ncbi:hypothetical protein SmJEL517_g02865 [Synchytrium microbalum]|uniref:SPRY domain-containing protein n=1 Tax=Synchytrium microbalum TaxID=1806994 RepID=A0A507C552_9FUNG|nr:uncharacterized protein SmJEL517_g02865 [Synchytrium microbalum]TPX34508.1 hypothetical protein SmJEL517_g02865 [Synchytrium microbalum]
MNARGEANDWEETISASLQKTTHSIKNLTTTARQEAHQRGAKDLQQLKVLTNQWKTQDRLLLTGLEAVAAIVNPQLRKQMLRTRLVSRVMNDKEANMTVEKHRDDFQRFIWKRRAGMDKDTRKLYEHSRIFRLGEEVSWASSERIRNFYVNNIAYMCKDEISWGLLTNNDILTLFNPKVSILPAQGHLQIEISSDGLSFELYEAAAKAAEEPTKPQDTAPVVEKKRTYSIATEATDEAIIKRQQSVFNRQPSVNEPRASSVFGMTDPTRRASSIHGPQDSTRQTSSVLVPPEFLATRRSTAVASAPPKPPPVYGRAYANTPLLFTNISMKSLILDTIGDLYIPQEEVSSYLLLARILDLAHGGHGLQASLLLNPKDVVGILRKKLSTLGYEVPELSDDERGKGDRLDVFMIVEQVQTRLLSDMRMYFEFTVPATTEWCVGICAENKINEQPEYPGADCFSMGFSSDGEAHWNGGSVAYQEEGPEGVQNTGMRVVGIMMDMKWLALHMVENGTILPAAFGNGAEAFNEEQIQGQIELLKTQPLLPMFALKCVKSSTYNATVYEKPNMKVNFGTTGFSFPIKDISKPYESVASRPAPRIYSSSTASSQDGVPSQWQQLVSSDNSATDDAVMNEFFKVNLIKEVPKSYSQFPPHVFRRSLAASIIQRAYRRHCGRRLRERIRFEQYAAACIIQRLARRWLVGFNSRREESAALIQRNWRKTLFIKAAILRCRYKAPLAVLHHSAHIIQRVWRTIKARKNRIPDVRREVVKMAKVQAKEKIVVWWREMRQRRLKRKTRKAVVDIQRCWRGYKLRKLLRSDLRDRLRSLGESVAMHRHELLRVRAALQLQAAWRVYKVRKMRRDSSKIRHKAATRIQAAFKGYWVRRHIHLRFTYGESVFLAAVCRALRHCHYLLRAYKPCALVPG